MKSYLGHCVIAFAIIGHIVVNAVPLPSNDESEPAAPELAESFTDFLFSDDPLLCGNSMMNANGGYDPLTLPTTSMTKESPNIGFTESAAISGPSSRSTTNDATYRVDKKNFSETDARDLITKMANNGLEEPSQYPWNKGGEWSDEVLQKVVECMHEWQRNAVREDKKRQKQGSKSSEGSRTWLPNATKRTAAAKKLNRTQLNSLMDTLWIWAIRQKSSSANSRCLSAQKKLSEMYQDPDGHRMSDKELIRQLLASIPTSNRGQSINTPWNGVHGTFQWRHSDHIKKVLAHIWREQYHDRQTLKRLNDLLNNGSLDALRTEMDKAWNWWIDQRQKGKIRRNKNRAAQREAQASSSSVPEIK